MSATAAGTVLVVDDNEVGRYTKRRQLEAAGFAVLEAATGQDALTTARQGGVDLVLLDIRLPDIRVIYVTGALFFGATNQFVETIERLRTVGQS